MLAELAELSNEQEHCQVIFAVVEYRIRSPEHKWRCVYKALQVLDYLLQRGSPHCCAAAQELLVPLAALQNFAYLGPDQKDYGQNVRLRAEAVKALILDTEGLAQKRAQLAARAGNMKFAGYSREDLVAVAAAGSAAAGPLSSTDSPLGRPVTPTPTLGTFGLGDGSGASATAVASIATAVPGSPSEGPLSPSVYRPPSAFAAGSATRMAQQPSSLLRGAGETKGVTFEQNKRQLEQLRQLTLLEGNRTCADCASAVAAARPTWASINLGVFICMRCAGIHRGLGVHISKVRSTTLDTWLPVQVATMARLGNRRANAYFEAGLDPAVRPARDNTLELERFIRLKYGDKVWAAKGPWPPEDDAVAVAVTVHHAATAQGTSVSKQPNGAVLRSPSPRLPASALPEPVPAAVWPSSWPPFAGSTGGGFSDAPPAWPSPTSSLTPPSSSQPTQTQQQQQAPPPQQQSGPRFGTPPPAPAFRIGASGAPVRLLPPPPSGPLPGRDGGVLSGSSADLLQLDSESDDDGEEGGGGSGANARDGTSGGPGSGAAALWDLLDPTQDVMTWLDHEEGAQQQRQQSHPRPPSAPAIGTIPAAAAPGAAPVPPSPSAVYPRIGVMASAPSQVARMPVGTVVGIGYGGGSAAGTTPAGVARLAAAESFIMTAEFPVYDLLTPLPTGGGPTPEAAAAPAAVVTGLARHSTTPPVSFSQAYPPAYLHHPAPHSAPMMHLHGGAPQPGGGGGSAAAAMSSSGLVATATTAATPPSNTAGLQRNTSMQSAGVVLGGSGMGMGVGMRGAGAAQTVPVTAAAGPGPALDLDNLLAMQLDSLGISLAGGPNGSATSGARPSWQPAAAVGNAYGGAGAGRR